MGRRGDYRWREGRRESFEVTWEEEETIERGSEGNRVKDISKAEKVKF